MSEYVYVGEELDLFAGATNWKAYWAERVRPFLGRRVLDVGAGLGATAKLLAGSVERWTCLEPDEKLARRLEAAIDRRELPPNCDVICGFLGEVGESTRFDSILYIDVLEHIERDAEQLQRSVPYLAKGGHLVVLAPAHNWLFSPFDASIGHHRRYNKRMLRQISPPGCTIVSMKYLDSLGLALSLANAVILRRSMPTPANISFWDRVVVPASRPIDFLLQSTVGKTIVAVWRRQ